MDKKLVHLENLDRILKQASFKDMKGEEHLSLAMSWLWLREYIKELKAPKAPPVVKSVEKPKKSKKPKKPKKDAK